MSNDGNDDDAWDAFGSDSDDYDGDGDEKEVGFGFVAAAAGDTNNDGEETERGGNGLDIHDINNDTDVDIEIEREAKALSSSVSLYLSQSFLKHNPQIKLFERHVLILSITSTDSNSDHGDDHYDTLISTTAAKPAAAATHWTQKSLQQRGVNVVVQRETLSSLSPSSSWTSKGPLSDFDAQGGDNRASTSISQTTMILFDAIVVLVFGLDPAILDQQQQLTGVSTVIHRHVHRNLCPGGKLLIHREALSVSVLDDKYDDGHGHGSPSTTNVKRCAVLQTLDNEMVEDLRHLQQDYGSAVVYKSKSIGSTATTVTTADKETENALRRDSKSTIIALTKKVCKAHTSMCRWLPARFQTTTAIHHEEARLAHATVALAAHEMAMSSSGSRPISKTTTRMTKNSIQRAVQCLQQFGYCILPGLLPSTQCKEWRQAVLEDVHSAASLLKRKHKVDIYNPTESQFEPQSYRELSMREDLRLDLRHGPALRKLRVQQKQESVLDVDQPIILTALDYPINGDDDGDDGNCNSAPFLQGHSGVLEIVRQTMNPRHGMKNGGGDDHRFLDSDLWKGNIGRYNFNGRGADGSYQDLRVSCVGGIVSFPGSADQALHADTPHLFEHIADLPAHYINVFASCQPFHEKVGGTAFIHGSHDLRFTAKYCASGADDTDNSKVYPFLVRPQLNMGDVILFDCRILHFGMSNASDSGIERCLCYANTTMHWFQDPKNWELNRCIFSKADYVDDMSKEDGRNIMTTANRPDSDGPTTALSRTTPKGCDTFVAFGPEKIIFGKNSDRPAGEGQSIKRYAARTWPDNSDDITTTSHTLKCTYISIPQVKETYAILISQIDWMWGAEHGTNEHGVVIGNEAVWTKATDEDLATERLLGMDLLRLGLERGRTAHEALTVITSLLEEHGQGGPCSQDDPSFTYHNSFLIADPSEAWVLETAGRQWVAKSYTDGHLNISNTLTIRDDYDICSSGLYDYARRHKLWSGPNDEQKLDWAATFGEGAVEECNSKYSRQCRGTTLLEMANKKMRPMSVEDMMTILRDCDSGICMHGGFETTASMVSELVRDSSSGQSHTHWMMDTPHPCKSKYEVYEVVSTATKQPEIQGINRKSSTKRGHLSWHAAVLLLLNILLLSAVAESRSNLPTHASRKAEKRIPQFMVEYFEWHTKQLQLLHEGKIDWESHQSGSGYSNRTTPVGRYLILRCTRQDRCGGTSDRVRSFPFFVFLAWRSKRLLFFRWERPYRIEEFFVPTSIWNWTVPDRLMAIVQSEQSDLKSSRQNFKKGRWEAFYFDGLAHERLKQVVQLPIVSLVEGNDYSGGNDHYERLMRLERMRSEEQEGMIAFQDRRKGSFAEKVDDVAAVRKDTGRNPVGPFRATLNDDRYENFYHDLFQVTFAPSEGVKNALHKFTTILRSDRNRKTEYIVAHYRATYPGEPFRESKDLSALQNIILHAVDCAYTIADGLPDGSSLTVYVASDAALALETVSYVYHNQTYVHGNDQNSGNAVVNGTVESLSARSVWTSIDIHRMAADRHQSRKAMKIKPMNNTNINAQPPAEDAPHLNFAKKDDPSGFYSIFVDIFLMSQAYCVTYGLGAGLFGVFGRLISRHPECNIPHTHLGGELATCYPYRWAAVS